jgi:thioredoxin reductase (NADPH)
VEICPHTEIADGSGDGRLQRLTLRDRQTGETETVDADALFVLIGAQPNTEWLPESLKRDEWQYVLTGEDIKEAAPDGTPYKMFETTIPRVFAVGDVRHRSVKRCASAVGEGSVVIQQVHRCLPRTEQPV